MTNQDIWADFNNLSQQMTCLKSTIKSQGIAQLILPFNVAPSKSKEWIPIHVLLNDVAPCRLILIAFQTSTGCVSYFLQRYLRKRFDLRLDRMERTDRLDRHDGPTPMDEDH